MGVSSIREFAAPLMMGIICGAYSSVCITGALWLVLKKKFVGGVKPAAVTAQKAPEPKKIKVSSEKKAAPVNTQQPKKKNRKRNAERLAAQNGEKKDN